jgi:hypothetical protein
MLDVLREKMISYQLSITDNRSTAHLVTITTACDLEVGTSKSEVRFANQVSSHGICLNYPCITILSNICSLVRDIVHYPAAGQTTNQGNTDLFLSSVILACPGLSRVTLHHIICSDHRLRGGFELGE